MEQKRALTREEVVARAIGDGGNTMRGVAAIEALHRAGWAIQKPPTDPAPLIASLREHGLLADADDVEALAMELDKFRRGWGPSTPTERMLRHADIITLRRFIEGAYAHLIELNMSNYTDDDVQELNDGAINAVTELQAGMAWVAERLQQVVSSTPGMNVGGTCA